jgi:hypothetical protein
LTVIVVGDICLTQPPVGQVVDAQYWTNLFGEDCRQITLIGTCEGTLGVGEVRPGRSAILDVNPALPERFSSFGRVVFSLANNHVSDRGLQGVIETQEKLSDLGFQSVGAGSNLGEARRPLGLEAKGVSIGILAYCDTREFVGGLAASLTSPGVAPLIAASIGEDIHQAKREFDQVWLLVHWGEEYFRYPSPETRTWAREWVEAGASLVVGCHSHNLQGREILERGQIFYSLGNFIFPPPMLAQGFPLHYDAISRNSLALAIDPLKREIRLLHYTLDKDGWPRRLGAAESQRATGKFEKLCLPLMEAGPSRYARLLFRDRWVKVWRRLRSMTWREVAHRAVRWGKLQKVS